MGKYIWPHQISEASYWYLTVLRDVVGGITLDELLDKIGDPAYGKKPSRRLLQRRLYNLAQSGLLEKNGSYKQSRFRITPAGVARLEQLSFIHYQPPPLQWDGHWRLVIFDIPETNREARDHVRRLLKELGFRQLQLSVWIHPLPLLKAFKEIRSAYGITAHLHLLEIVNFLPPAHLLADFATRYPNLKLNT